MQGNAMNNMFNKSESTTMFLLNLVYHFKEVTDLLSAPNEIATQVFYRQMLPTTMVALIWHLT